MAKNHWVFQPEFNFISILQVCARAHKFSHGHAVQRPSRAVDLNYPHLLIGWLRLVLVLALALVGAHHGATVKPVRTAVPVTASETLAAPIILTAHSHMMRAQLPDGDTPRDDWALSEIPAPIQTVALQMSRETRGTLPASEIHILPRVRGPPAV